jgi:hypothetical protein
MDGDKTEAVLGDHLHRCLDVIDHHKRGPVGAEDREGLLAITRASLQVHHLVRAESMG